MFLIYKLYFKLRNLLPLTGYSETADIAARERRTPDSDNRNGELYGLWNQRKLYESF